MGYAGALWGRGERQEAVQVPSVQRIRGSGAALDGGLYGHEDGLCGGCAGYWRLGRSASRGGGADGGVSEDSEAEDGFWGEEAGSE